MRGTNESPSYGLGCPAKTYRELYAPARISYGNTAVEQPEEPAKYIHEIPKLAARDLSHSAVTCGNWIAQVRQVLVGLSPSAAIWCASMEQAANYQYQRWLVADPLDRLTLDPMTVIAAVDMAKYQRVESRAVTLTLAAIAPNFREEAASNRWLAAASLPFRIQCVYQRGDAQNGRRFCCPSWFVWKWLNRVVGP